MEQVVVVDEWADLDNEFSWTTWDQEIVDHRAHGFARTVDKMLEQWRTHITQCASLGQTECVLVDARPQELINAASREWHSREVKLVSIHVREDQKYAISFAWKGE